jgi:hypothetical protein
MSGERIDALLVAGGALWASAAVHTLALIAGGVLYDEPPDRITVELREPAPAEAAPPAASSEASVPAVASTSPETMSSTGGTSGSATGDERDPRDWRERLRRDEARVARAEMKDAARLALLRRDGDEVSAGVYRCGLEGAAPLTDVRIRRDLSRLAPIFPGRVLSDDYLAKIGEVGGRRVGQRMAFDLVLPTELLTLPLEAPDVLVAVGREDRRCFVRITVGGDLFPLHLLGLPVRVVDAAGSVHAAVVDVGLNIDASVDILQTYDGALPFTRGRLRDGAALAETMREHQGIFRAVRALSD